jgi:D-alanine-D-alanine ligase
MGKTTVYVIYGGKSTEHEVSLRSARSILAALDREKYNVCPIAITKGGQWLGASESLKLIESETSEISASLAGNSIELLPQAKNFETLDQSPPVLFPILHGRYGEDGCLQGLLEIMGLPYVGCGVLSSAVGMDKISQKEIFSVHGIPTPKYLGIRKSEIEKNPTGITETIEEFFKSEFPLFVKPANTGSSVGVLKVRNSNELLPALHEASRYDLRIIVEEGLENIREIEVAVLGTDPLTVSCAGEIVPANEFYDYAAKYADSKTEIIVPANISADTQSRLQQYAKEAFYALDCSGFSRIDFFVQNGKIDRIWINEINTIPGFTNVSVFPRLLEASGVSYVKIVDTLIELAIEKWKEKQKIETSFF